MVYISWKNNVIKYIFFLIFYCNSTQRGTEEAPENGKEPSHSAHAKGMNEWMVILHDNCWHKWLKLVVEHWWIHSAYRDVFILTIKQISTTAVIYYITVCFKCQCRVPSSWCDIQTYRRNIRLYLCISKVHPLKSWKNNLTLKTLN